MATLHRHALESIFAFLDLRELAWALQVGRSWLVAVGSMRRLDLSVERPTEPLAIVAQSAMSRHIGQLGGGGHMVRLSGADLSLIAERMVHLRELHCMVDELPPPGRPQPLLFPAQLQRLHVDLTHSAVSDAALINSVFVAIGRLALLEDLTVRLAAMDPLISFAPLAGSALPLASLTIRTRDGEAEMSDAQVDQLRALTHLLKLTVTVSAGRLRRLLRQPHSLHWQQIWLPHPLDDETAALLAQLPSLTAIHCQIHRPRFEWLCGLPNLTDVGLLFEDAEVDAEMAAPLLAALQHCTTIEILTLSSCSDLTAAHLADLLPLLPRLWELCLAGLSIDSLSFLAQPPLTIQLRTLRVWLCTQLPPSELRHVHALRGLTELELFRSFAAPLGPDDLSLLEPPSAALPLLERFYYIAPDDSY